MSEILLSKSNSGEFVFIQLEIQIGNRIFHEEGVLDTGSKKSCLNRSFITNNKLEQWVENDESMVIGVNGESLTTNEKISADILFKNGTATRHEWIIMESLPVAILVGTDIMKSQGKVTVDFDKGVVTDAENIVLLNDTLTSTDGICDMSTIESDDTKKPTKDKEVPESIFNNSKLNDDQKNQVKQLLGRYRDIIIEKNEDAVCENFEATIPILDTAEPFTYNKPYPIDLNLQAPAKEIIDKWLADKKIEKTQSPYNAPVVVVLKKRLPGDPPEKIRVRPCLDFRKLNKVIAADPCITERLGDVLAQTTSHKWRSSFDMPSAYLQIPLAKKDRHKTAFMFLGTQYQFCYCPFGLNVSGSAFQRAMNKVMDGLDRRYIRSYVDDVLCTTETFEQHLIVMEQFFNNVRKHGMKLSYEKMAIGQEKLLFLGMELTDKGFGINPKKIEGITGITELKSKKDARSYIGLLGFFKSHIPCFSERTRAISDSIQGSTFKFTPEMQKEMAVLREMISKRPIRAYPMLGEKFILYTDASHHTAAYALCQIQHDEERIIHDGGRKFPADKLHLSIFEKELWAVKIALKTERYLLRGTRFTLKTDSLAVCNCLAPKAKELRAFPSDKIARWCQEILDFDFELVKIKSEENLLADAISRLPRDTTPSPEKILVLDVPDNSREIQDLLKHVHDNMGHGGINRTLRLLRRNATIKNDRKLVQNWVQSCKFCQEYRHYTGNGTSANIADYDRPERPLERVQVDLHCISPVSVAGFKYIMGIICELTSYGRFYALRTKSAKETAGKIGRFLTEEGASVKTIKTDMGTEFLAEFLDKAQEHGVSVEKATPYWRKKNAIVERGFGKLKSCLKSIGERNKRTWVINLGRANLLYNALPQQVTGLSPFQAVYGQACRIGQELVDERPREEIEAILNDKWANWGRKQHKEPSITYDVNQKVLIRIPPKAESGMGSKYGKLYQGPYTVIEKINPATYVVQVDKRTVKKNVAQLRPYVERLDSLFERPDDPLEDFSGSTGVEGKNIRSKPIKKVNPDNRSYKPTTLPSQGQVNSRSSRDLSMNLKNIPPNTAITSHDQSMNGTADKSIQSMHITNHADPTVPTTPEGKLDDFEQNTITVGPKQETDNSEREEANKHPQADVSWNDTLGKINEIHSYDSTPVIIPVETSTTDTNRSDMRLDTVNWQDTDELLDNLSKSIAANRALREEEQESSEIQIDPTELSHAGHLQTIDQSGTENREIPKQEKPIPLRTYARHRFSETPETSTPARDQPNKKKITTYSPIVQEIDDDGKISSVGIKRASLRKQPRVNYKKDL